MLCGGTNNLHLHTQTHIHNVQWTLACLPYIKIFEIVTSLNRFGSLTLQTDITETIQPMCVMCGCMYETMPIDKNKGKWVLIWCNICICMRWISLRQHASEVFRSNLQSLSFVFSCQVIVGVAFHLKIVDEKCRGVLFFSSLYSFHFLINRLRIVYRSNKHYSS